ncbi:MAG: signal recognition particle-docking protein FtsY, partial [Mailhella sp.]|nr:signal recognition particle-docking protein FtsY [Mailhella sp.]
MGFFSAVKKFFTGGSSANENKKGDQSEELKEAAEPQEAEAGEEPSDAAKEAEPAKVAEAPKAPADAAEAEEVVEVVAEAEELPAEVTPAPAPVAAPAQPAAPEVSPEEEALALALRQAEPKLSAWLAVVLDGVEEADDLLWKRLGFLLRALETPAEEAQAFMDDFRGWLKRMDYRWLDDFRSELQYRLALALDMEDEEDERDRLFSKLQAGLARTSERFGQGLKALFSGHTELNDAFWEEMEELFIMADMGAEPTFALV